MKRMSSFAKMQISLLLTIAIVFGTEAYLSQTSAPTTPNHIHTSHVNKLRCATEQTLQFVKVISQIFEKANQRP